MGKLTVADVQHKDINDADFAKLLRGTILIRPIEGISDTVFTLEEPMYKYVFDSLKSGSKISVDSLIFEKYMSYIVFNINMNRFVVGIEETTNHITNIITKGKFSICLSEEEYNRKGGRRKYNRWFKVSDKDKMTMHVSLLIVADKNKRARKAENETI